MGWVDIQGRHVILQVFSTKPFSSKGSFYSKGSFCRNTRRWNFMSQVIGLDGLYSVCGFRLPSFYFGGLLLMLVFCVATCVAPTNIRNKQSCERLALADVGRCRAMKSQCTIRPFLQTVPIPQEVTFPSLLQSPKLYENKMVKLSSKKEQQTNA